MSTTTPSFMDKLKGEKTVSGLPGPKVRDVVLSAVGGFLIIALLYLLHADLKAVICFIVPFGASAVLVFAAPAAPFSQPRNLIGGHIISALVGVTVFVIFRQNVWWALAIANCFAIALMVATKTVHPPAGATALLPIVSGIDNYIWVLMPVLVGSLMILVIGLIYNNLWQKRRYPVFWW